MADMEPRTARGVLGHIARKLGILPMSQSFKKTPQELVDLIGDSAGIPKEELQKIMGDMEALKGLMAELGDEGDAAPAPAPAPSKKDPIRRSAAAPAPTEAPPARGRGRGAPAPAPAPVEEEEEVEEVEEEEEAPAPAPAPARGRGRGAAAPEPVKEPARGRGAAPAGRGRGAPAPAPEPEVAPEPTPKDPVRGARGGRGRGASPAPAETGTGAGEITPDTVTLSRADYESILANIDGLKTAVDSLKQQIEGHEKALGDIGQDVGRLDAAATLVVTELFFLDDKQQPLEDAPTSVLDIEDIEAVALGG